MLILFALLTVLSPVDRHAVGFIQPDGAVQDMSHATVGWVRRAEREWVVESKGHAVIGYVTFDGTLFDASRRAKGRIRGDRLENASGALVENLSKVPEFQAKVAWAFFFKTSGP